MIQNKSAKTKAKDSRPFFTKKNLVISFAIFDIAVALCLLAIPFYEGDVSLGPSYVFFPVYFQQASNLATGIVFLVSLILSVLLLCVGAGFQLSALFQKKDHEDAADKRYMLGSILSIAGAAFMAVTGIADGIIIVMVLSLVDAGLGFFHLIFYFKKFAYLAGM